METGLEQSGRDKPQGRLRRIEACGSLDDPVSRPTMHYPHKISRKKKIRAVGFRKRMSTRKGRKIINSKRRNGRKIGVR